MRKYNARSFTALLLKNAAYNAILARLEYLTSNSAQKGDSEGFWRQTATKYTRIAP
jgi:hypothetical protein